MGNQDFGESSRQNRNEENTRPLKKAKYVWQVKGKYHLRATCPNDKSEANGMEETDSVCTNYKNKEDLCKNNCVDKFLQRTEAILDSDEEDSASKNIDRSISSEIPITLVSPNPKNQDYYLRKWQARQIARGYIDNTINSVFETWVSAPFDAEDFVEKCDDDGHIEDEGILMAIQSHGLQSIKSSKKEPSLSFVRPDELADNTLDKFETVRSEIIKKGLGWEFSHNSCSSEERDIEAEANLDIIYPMDILNAAILAAIERKGLSSV